MKGAEMMPDNKTLEEYARAAVAVNLADIANNVRAIRDIIGSEPMIMAVVKADGYGYGSYEIANAALNAGATWLGVATVDEGKVLRDAGLQAPTLLLNPIFEEEFESALLSNLAVPFFGLAECEKMSKLAASLGKTAEIHIKLDTGMNRIGFNAQHAESTVSEILAISKLPNINIGGIYSQFAASPSNAEFTNEQFSRFCNILKLLDEAGLHIPIKHISNSGAVLNHPECKLDMVRCGIILFGMSPCSTPQGAAKLAERGFKPATALKSRVAHVKTVKKGESVGYSRNYYAQEDITVVTIPVGYADGISRHLSNKGKVLINGHFCDIIGSICMDQLMINATGSNAKLGDDVVIFGHSGGMYISAEEVAQLQGSINYEVSTSLSLRIPRKYI